jgi:hypothetical protein
MQEQWNTVDFLMFIGSQFKKKSREQVNIRKVKENLNLENNGSHRITKCIENLKRSVCRRDQELEGPCS